MKKIYIKIEGMHCSHCEDTIRTNLLHIKHICAVEFDGAIACITYKGKISQEELITTILNQGYITKKEFISDDIQELKNRIQGKEFFFIVLFILFLVLLIYKIFGFNIFNVIPAIDSSITYGVLFLTGILTSIHCISMCGAINLVAVVGNSSKRNFKRPVLYNLGRVLSYTILGGIVGFIGSVISISKTVSGMIILIASLIMFLMSLNMLGILNLKRISFLRHKQISRNAFVIGLLNGLMPCGPLQAMQVYALQTGSFTSGAFSMLLFGLGTVPFMLFAGILLNLVKGRGKILVNKIASVLILLLSIVMLNRGLLALNMDVFRFFHDDAHFITSTLKEDHQLIEFDLSYDNYQDIIVQKDLPVKMVIHVDKKYLTGCNQEIIIEEYGIKQELKVGDNIIEFTPTKEETITYTCFMNMIKNTIKVIDNEKYFKGE